MPGAVARTSAFALNNATLPFALKIANLGAEEAMRQDPHLANGLNVSDGKIRHEAVAEALDLTYEPVADLRLGAGRPGGAVARRRNPALSTNGPPAAHRRGAFARISRQSFDGAFAIAERASASP